MPNHDLVLFKVETVPMSEIVGAWKKLTGRLTHKLRGRSGAFGAEDYFDAYMLITRTLITRSRYAAFSPKASAARFNGKR